ncbi:PC-esterase domain-containing protein 1A-like [Periplaneta americana]|uniref:PC-esterase domain-containing protein 1A-like n=1 Tax=Periplaneta americana TaxID=6978 RepID=UPI0037E78282
MADIFLHKDAVNLLHEKHVIFFGDSNMRSLYKDFVWLLNRNSLIAKDALKRKLETTFLGDSLVKCTELHKGRDFEEVRRYQEGDMLMEFFFITRCYNSNIENVMSDVREKRRRAPDIIIMNSCLWDITRWGPNGVTEYKDNMMKLMRSFKSSLPPETLVIWTTTPPVSASCHGALLIKQVEFLHHTLRFEVMEANMFSRQVVVAHGYDVVDIHHHLRMQLHRRAGDGIHWLPAPVRHMTNLLLTHIALSWDCQLPGNFKSNCLEKMKNLEIEKKTEIIFPVMPRVFLEINKNTQNSTVGSQVPATPKKDAESSLNSSRKRRNRNEKSKKTPLKQGPLLPTPHVNQENINTNQQVPNVAYNIPWKPVTMYNNHWKPVCTSQSLYGQTNGSWQRSYDHRQQRKFMPYYL